VNGIYITAPVTAAIACTNTAFGKDPIRGYVKACDYSNSTLANPVVGTYKIRTHMNTNYCGDMPSATNGTALRLWSCGSGNLNQSMSVTAAGEIRVQGKCLHVTSATSGSPVVVQDCNGSANQKWSYNSTTRQFTGYNSLCMDLSGSSVVNGANINAYNCQSTANQQWDLTAP
jgi:endo-1,4-beta-xylanase